MSTENPRSESNTTATHTTPEKKSGCGGLIIFFVIICLLAGGIASCIGLNSDKTAGGTKCEICGKKATHHFDNGGALCDEHYWDFADWYIKENMNND